jgi:hypothetical protein
MQLWLKEVFGWQNGRRAQDSPSAQSQFFFKTKMIKNGGGSLIANEVA